MIHTTITSESGAVPIVDALVAAPRTNAFRERAAGWLGLLLSVAILAVVATQIGQVELSKIAGLAPREPFFWIVFAASYLLAPAAEWAIYRRIWQLPATGMVPLLRKQVANEIVLGYSGDAHFYLWARRHAGVTGSPFGAIKDVAMLSAVAGNAATLLMMLAAAPLLAELLTGPVARTFGLSVAIVVALSLAIFVFRRALFSLPSRDLHAIIAVHFSRIALSVVLLTAMWHALLPTLGLGALLSLATLRMMLWRLPLLPSKDVLFAGLVVMLLGRHTDVSAAMALMASLVVGTHVVVGVLAGAVSIAIAEATRRQAEVAEYRQSHSLG
jgi:hypothetical protein